MKLKSLKITTFLFLAISAQSAFSETNLPLSTGGCLDKVSTYSKYSGAKQSQCNSFLTQYNAEKDPAKKEELKEAFDREFATQTKIEAESAAAVSDDPYCTAKVKKKPALVKDVQPYGSGGLNKCDTLFIGNMRTLYENGSRASLKWKEYVQYDCREKCNEKEKDENGKDAFANCVEDNYKIAKKCESVAFIINSYGRKWSNPDQVAAVEGTSSSGAVGAKTQQAANGASATVSIGSNSPIKCVSKGIETVDYDSCKEFQVKLDLMDGVQQVGYAAQEMVYKEKMVDAQAKYATEQNTATGALKAQGESLKDQEGMFQQRTVVDTAKLGYLYTIYNEFPKASDVKAKCANIKSAISNADDEIKGSITTGDCETAVSPGQGGFAITMNQQQIENMRARLIGIATSAGSNLLLANLLGKRADDVNNAIAKIDAFKPADPFTTTEADAQTSFCRMNPGVASCLTGDLERTFDTMNDNIITFGDGATGTSYGTKTNPDGTPILNNVVDTGSRTAVGPVGSVIAAAAQDNSMEQSDAASVKSGGIGASGSGGGGSGGGASGGGGGGGSPAAAAAGQAAAISARAPSYNGGGGTFSVMGGFGINKKKGDGKTEDNPFGKLFGKDGAPKGDVVNFRDIASQKVGGKGDNLFDMISKRYTSVNADKRLLEYELKK